MKTIKSMFEHVDWANTKLLDKLGSMDPVHPKALRLIAHVVSAEQVWLTRLGGEDSSAMQIWPEDPVLEELKQRSEQNREGYLAFLAELDEEKLDTILHYRNQSGKAFETSIRDILTHVALHGQYHRGQINTLLRADGEEPVALDYILFAR